MGIEDIAAYSPQARWRSERVFRTLQYQLPKYLKLAGIATIKAANRRLRDIHISSHNAMFAVAPEQTGSGLVADTVGV